MSRTRKCIRTKKTHWCEHSIGLILLTVIGSFLRITAASGLTIGFQSYDRYWPPIMRKYNSFFLFREAFGVMLLRYTLSAYPCPATCIHSLDQNALHTCQTGYGTLPGLHGTDVINSGIRVTPCGTNAGCPCTNAGNCSASARARRSGAAPSGTSAGQCCTCARRSCINAGNYSTCAGVLCTGAIQYGISVRQRSINATRLGINAGDCGTHAGKWPMRVRIRLNADTYRVDISPIV